MLTVAIAIAAVVVTVVAGYWFTVGILAAASRGAARRNEGSGPSSKKAREALRGGRWIGYLERTGITLAIILGEPSGIALIIAIKGLGRFAELKGNPDASERFVIGTFASTIFAALVGVLANWLIAQWR